MGKELSQDMEIERGERETQHSILMSGSNYTCGHLSPLNFPVMRAKPTNQPFLFFFMLSWVSVCCHGEFYDPRKKCTIFFPHLREPSTCSAREPTIASSARTECYDRDSRATQR